MGERNEFGARVGRLFLALLIGLTSISLIVFIAGSTSVLKRVFDARPSAVLWLFTVSIGVILVDSLRTVILCGGLKKRIKYAKALENSILGFYVSAITPFSAGGQPFQIYHLTRVGLNVEEASTVVGLKFVTSFSVSVALGLIALIEFSEDIKRIPAVGPIMYLGMSLTVMMYVFFLFMAMGGKFTEAILSSKVISYPIAFFLRKNAEEVRKTAVEKVRSYTEMIRGYWRRSVLRFLANVFLSFSMVILILSSPYFSISAVSSESLEYTKILGLQVAMNMVVYFLPTPGSSGGVEGMFYLVFSDSVGKEAVASALVLWRFFTYYLVIIIGNVVVSRYIRSR